MRSPPRRRGRSGSSSSSSTRWSNASRREPTSCSRLPRAIAEIDVLAALAQCAAERGYVRPTFVDESIVAIEDGRHPVMEAVLHAKFVPNDLDLRAGEHRFVLLTGPNMGGKSTYLRQAGLLTIMAQIGSFVPAKKMELGVIDRIFTRIGAGDDLASGQSTFYMEMAEAANILRRSTQRSLLLIDEVGRGTGTLDGLAIAQAICEFLLGLEEQVTARALCDALSRAVRAQPIIGARLRTIISRRSKIPRAAARRSFRIACNREVRRARSESRLRVWRDCPKRSSSERRRSPTHSPGRPTSKRACRFVRRCRSARRPNARFRCSDPEDCLSACKRGCSQATERRIT